MEHRVSSRGLAAAALALIGAVSPLGTLPTAAQQPAAPAAEPGAAEAAELTVGELSTRVWTTARGGNEAGVLDLLRHLPDGAELTPDLTRLRDSFETLDANLAKREAARQTKLAEVDSKLDEKLRETGAEALSESVKLAVERFLLSTDKGAFKTEPRIAALVQRAETAAREAEAAGDWFTANELFFRLNALLEEEGTYREDVKRLGQRLSMIRLYVPEEFWRLRNQERIRAGKPELPPYNALGEDFNKKLQGIDELMVMRAIARSAEQQVERVPLRDSIAGGASAVRTMITTKDLQQVFPGVADERARAEMLAFLDGWDDRLANRKTVIGRQALVDFTKQLLEANRRSVRLPDEAVLHEFGNGAMSVLDDFSAIIWPDELSRFNRMTEGVFRGVGISIQMDEETQMIKVITPLEGTPAQRAGIRAGDLIKKINGDSAVGLTLTQAVDLITGPADSQVTITVERATGEKDENDAEITQDIDFPLTRAVIPMATVKGWRRTGAREDQWDWFIDRENKIGYVRLLQFTDKTTQELRAAVRQMKDEGLRAMILDLRFNPGGLLTEAVSVANAFIEQGVIVSTDGTVQSETRSAVRADAMLTGIPVAVLINEGSASASEIVSGAIRHYADKGDIDAVLVGKRTFGKGSVQNVWPLAENAKMKLTTQYYKLPDGSIIHRKPGQSTWGVAPHLEVTMLPEAMDEALRLRQDADVLPLDDKGQVAAPRADHPDPAKLLTDGLDLQLQTALLLLQTRTVGQAQAHVRLPAEPVATNQ